MHVVTSSQERLLDYVRNTPTDGMRAAESVNQRSELIRRNLEKGLR
jgi:4-O-beta-D-mannosyl-D-glucose phosphorylase